MDDILSLIIVGALAGTAAASVMGLRGKRGGGFTYWIRNTIIGIIGALVGAFLLDVLNIGENETTGILSASISLADLLVAFVGAIIVIFLVGLIRN
jgi:uncharacterized membrane protein YeaQ/YmgE (transglycosylase-associated protein family)